MTEPTQHQTPQTEAHQSIFPRVNLIKPQKPRQTQRESNGRVFDGDAFLPPQPRS